MSLQEGNGGALKGYAALWAALVPAAKSGLSALGHGDWAVLRNYNPAAENYNPPLIALQRIMTAPKPWAASHDRTAIRDGKETLLHIESVIETVSFRISAFAKRDVSGETGTAEAWDVLCGLRLWISGDAGLQCCGRDRLLGI